MGIDHDVVLGGLADDVEIMVVHGLRVVVVAAGYDVAYVARLHGVVAVAVHQLEGVFEVALVVLGARRRLVVHQQLDALAVGVVVEHLKVEVGVGCLEVEDVALPQVGPVFPAYVPPLDEDLVQTVLGREVDVSFYLFVVGGVAAVGLGLTVVEGVELDAGLVVGVVPVGLAHYHLPPYAAVLRGVYP